MNFLQNFSSSLLGYFSRTFIYYHFIVSGIFGLGYALFIKNYQFNSLDVYRFLPIVFTFSLFMVGIQYVLNGNSELTFKRVIRIFLKGCIGSILGIGLLVSWFFFEEEYKNGYFSLAFSIVTIQAILLYILVTISDWLLQGQTK
ncbi:hypothetical protein [Bacillus cereus]|uniref:hypothetical protein n=1 Tax=Bacillus cereus TaxID=1396 RepID=UPI0035CC0404